MIRLFVCGDVRLDEDGVAFDSELAELISSCDLALANLEGPEIEPLPADALLKAGPHVFNPRGTVERLRDAGFHLLTLGNNHIGDYGRNGVAATLEACRRAGVAACGAGVSPQEAHAPARLKTGGKKISVFSLGEDGFGGCGRVGASWGYARVGEPGVWERLEAARGECDLLIVVAHAGLEECPVPLPCWRETYRMLIRAGADWVVAHHPHVPQGCEIYRGKRIDYSLGNFFFDFGGMAEHNALQYVVVAEFPDDGAPRFQRIPCRASGGRVRIDHDSLPELERLDALLQEPLYGSCVAEHCRKRFDSEYLRSFFLAAGAAAGNAPGERFKGAAKSLLTKRDRLDGSRLLMARHLFGNETNREVIRIALDSPPFFS